MATGEMAGRYDDDVGTKDGAGVRDGRGLEEGVATPGTTQPISRGLATWASAIVMLTAKGRSIKLRIKQKYPSSISGQGR